MKKVLCPVDFSENSMEAARFAIKFASFSHAEIKFFYVSSVIITTAGTNVDAPAQQLRLRLEELEQQIDKLYAEIGLVRGEQNVICETLDYASISHGIADAAEKYAADLIIMGTTGASGLKRFLVGSVTTSVLDLVNCPVLAIPAEFSGREIHRIGMATNVIDVKQEIFIATNFAKIFGAELDLFHISVRQPDEEKLTDELSSLTGYDKISFTDILPEFEGDVIGGLNSYVETRKPDVLIMFHIHRNWLDKLISGSRTKQMLFHSNAAILTFKREKTEND